MQTRLDYRGLRRWSMLILFPVLLLSSWVAALLMMMVSLPIMLPAFSAAAIAGVGIFGVAALIIPPVIGTVAGLLGILRAKTQVVRAFNASPLPNDHPLVSVTQHMAARLGMPAPEVYVYPDEDVNAWATGTLVTNAAVGLSRGALNRLSRDQVHAVVGHELGHIAAGDLRRMSFAVSFQNALVWFFGFRSWRWNAQHIFGFVGQMGIMGMSRRREYWADAIGAVLTSPEMMRDALRVVERNGKRPDRKRKYFNQLMFNWPGGSLLASHPTFSQRYAALDEGAFEMACQRKMRAASSRMPETYQEGATRPQPLEGRLEAWANSFDTGPALAAAAFVLVLVGGGAAVDFRRQDTEADYSVSLAYAPEPVPVTAAPRVAGWTAEAPSESEVRPPEPVKSGQQTKMAAIDDLAHEPPGYRCFKVLDRRLPSGVTQAFDEQKEWLVYAATTASSASVLRELPNALRGCLKQSGGKLQSQSSSVENRRIEIWAFANETTCWFTPQADKRGSEAPNVIGRCHSPED